MILLGGGGVFHKNFQNFRLIIVPIFSLLDKFSNIFHFNGHPYLSSRLLTAAFGFLTIQSICIVPFLKIFSIFEAYGRSNLINFFNHSGFIIRAKKE